MSSVKVAKGKKVVESVVVAPVVVAPVVVAPVVALVEEKKTKKTKKVAEPVVAVAVEPVVAVTETKKTKKTKKVAEQVAEQVAEPVTENKTPKVKSSYYCLFNHNGTVINVGTKYHGRRPQEAAKKAFSRLVKKGYVDLTSGNRTPFCMVKCVRDVTETVRTMRAPKLAEGEVAQPVTEPRTKLVRHVKTSYVKSFFTGLRQPSKKVQVIEKVNSKNEVVRIPYNYVSHVLKLTEHEKYPDYAVLKAVDFALLRADNRRALEATKPTKKETKPETKPEEPKAQKTKKEKAEPVKAEPVKAEPVKAEPVKVEPTKKETKTKKTKATTV